MAINKKTFSINLSQLLLWRMHLMPFREVSHHTEDAPAKRLLPADPGLETPNPLRNLSDLPWLVTLTFSPTGGNLQRTAISSTFLLIAL